jgi:hypothetical protein
MGDLNLEDMMGGDEPQTKSGIQREEPQMEQGAEQFVTKWQKRILASKSFYEKDFKRMREDMMIARQGGSKDWVDQGNYTVPIINRYLNQAVASLYAKNPTATAEKRKTLDYALWDGKPDTAIKALNDVQMLQAAQAGDPEAQELVLTGAVDPNAMDVVQDIEEGRQKHEMLTKIGRTLEVIFDYYANEQKPRLKPLMKSFVRRAKTCSVAYLMLGFQREFAELTPDDTVLLADSRNKLGELQRRMQDMVDGEIADSDQDEAFELENMINEMELRQEKIMREGPKFMFPRATEIIVDPRCTQLMGFIGAGWIAREFHKSPDEIKKIYQVEVKQGYTPYRQHGQGELADYHRKLDSEDKANGTKEDGMVCVWEIYNKELEETFTICDGHKGFLVAPKEPDYWMEGFWPVFALTFNDVESETELYPPSDVHMLKHVQAEYNRAREYRRLHREANKPKYAAVKGRLSKEDKKLLSNAPAHSVIEFDGMGNGEKIGDLVQQFDSKGLDPALYETNSEMEDVLRIVGAQEANIGGTSGASATEVSIGEGGRMTSLSSNVDDLDEFLSDVFGALGQLCIKELSVETVMEIVGKGAVWPEQTREEIAKQIYLKIRAGSSGRPNKAAELANMERGMPYLIQLPGVNPYPLGQRYADLLEIDLDEIIVEGMPSIQALNTSAGKGMTEGVGTEDDPNAQGGEGGKANKTDPNEPGAQPSYQNEQQVMSFDENGNLV